MTDNAINADGAEVYQHDIFYYADQYIADELGGDDSIVPKFFPAMILYIHDHIDKPSNDDIYLLDYIFNIYLRLCVKYSILPTLEIFSLLIGVSRSTLTTWANGEYRVSTPHSITVKRWFSVCKSMVVDRLHNKGGTDANLIFAAKAAYGMAETAPVRIDRPVRRILGVADLPKLGGESTSSGDDG